MLLIKTNPLIETKYGKKHRRYVHIGRDEKLLQMNFLGKLIKLGIHFISIDYTAVRKCIPPVIVRVCVCLRCQSMCERCEWSKCSQLRPLSVISCRHQADRQSIGVDGRRGLNEYVPMTTIAIQMDGLQWIEPAHMVRAHERCPNNICIAPRKWQRTEI